MKTLIIIITVLIITVLMLTGCFVNKQGGASKENAYYITQQFIKDRLRSPSTANFPNYYQVKNNITQTAGKTFTVNSYLDAQNGFGATIRRNYTCTVKHKTNNTWNLINLSMEKEK